MKRSQVNKAAPEATAFFQSHGWHLPPEASWDVTDFSMNFQVQVNNKLRSLMWGELMRFTAGEGITLEFGVYPAFCSETEGGKIGEVSTINDDLNDNFFINPEMGRYSEMEEDAAPLVKRINEE